MNDQLLDLLGCHTVGNAGAYMILELMGLAGGDQNGHGGDTARTFVESRARPYSRERVVESELRQGGAKRTAVSRGLDPRCELFPQHRHEHLARSLSGIGHTGLLGKLSI